MNVTVPLALFGWIPLVLLLFALIRPQTAILIGFLGAWMFLPMAGYNIQGFLDYTKTTASSLAVFLGMFLFCTDRVAGFRPKLLDLPMLLWCLWPLGSSLSNGLGLYDGLSNVLYTTVMWGIPYFAGRVFFTDIASLRQLAVALVIGGLVYVPFCLFELKMSPQLHKIVYGYHQHAFGQTVRFGGWRPMVFMQHGLMLSMWMGIATLSAACLWLFGRQRSIGGIPTAWATLVLAWVFIACKSMGAVATCLLGFLAVASALLLRTRLGLWILLLIPAMYVGERGLLGWDGEELLDWTREVEPARVESVRGRLGSEDYIIGRAHENVLFGRASDAYQGTDEAKGIWGADAMWAITLGWRGWGGLLTLMGTLLLPCARFLRRTRKRAVIDPSFALPLTMALLVMLFLIDGLFNYMFNPIYAVALGGLAGLSLSDGTHPRASRLAQPSVVC